MRNYNVKLKFNHIVIGKKNTYDSYEIRPNNLKFLEGSNFLLLLSHVSLPKKYSYFFSKYYKSTDEVKNLKVTRLIYSYVFIPVKDSFAAAIIGEDIVLVK